MKKSVSLVLLATLLLQSCVLYQTTPIPISESTNNGKVKIVMTNGEKVALKHIEYDFINGTYWGLKKGYSKDHQYKIDPTRVAEVYLISKHDSRTASVVVTLAIVIAISLTIWFTVPFF